MDGEGFDATLDDVEKLVREGFAAEEHDLVWGLLQGIETAVAEHSARRVQVAALMLARGDRSELERQVDVAAIDYRDVLAPAFYPDEYDEPSRRGSDDCTHVHERRTASMETAALDADDHEVEFRWKEEVVYWEGRRGYVFPGGWGVTPPVTYVPTDDAWDRVMPEWLKGRRNEVVRRLEVEPGHTLRVDPGYRGDDGAELTR